MHQIYICELQKILMHQLGRGLITGYEGHIDVMKYDKNTMYNVYILTYTCSKKHNKLTDDITM